MLKTLIISFSLVGISASAGIGLDQVHQFSTSEPEMASMSIVNEAQYVTVAEVVFAPAPNAQPTRLAFSNVAAPLALQFSPRPQSRPFVAARATSTQTSRAMINVSPEFEGVGRSETDPNTRLAAPRSRPTLAPRVRTTPATPPNTLLQLQPIWAIGVFR